MSSERSTFAKNFVARFKTRPWLLYFNHNCCRRRLQPICFRLVPNLEHFSPETCCLHSYVVTYCAVLNLWFLSHQQTIIKLFSIVFLVVFKFTEKYFWWKVNRNNFFLLEPEYPTILYWKQATVNAVRIVWSMKRRLQDSKFDSYLVGVRRLRDSRSFVAFEAEEFVERVSKGFKRKYSKKINKIRCFPFQNLFISVFFVVNSV